jgi:hypothetical protein
MMMAVVIFGGELKIAFFLLHLWKKKKSSVSSQIPVSLSSIIPCQKTTENGSIEMKSCLELAAW